MSSSSISISADSPVAAPHLGPARPESTTTPRLRRWIRNAGPTAAVLTVLGGLAFWGHHSDWKLPKFSSLVGTAEKKRTDWCDEHGVPESQCIECNETLVPPLKDYGFCKEHGVAQCPFHHPEVAQLKELPVIARDKFEQATRALALRPRRENNARCEMHSRRIQFASMEAMEKAGVDIAVVQSRPVIEAVVANGEIVYDSTASAALASRVAGSVWRIEKQQGERVRAGDVLALVDSSTVGAAKANLLQSVAQLRLRQGNVQRLQPLADKVVAGRQLNEAVTAQEEARIAVAAAQQALANLGLDVQVEELLKLDTDELAERVQSLGLPTETIPSFDARTSMSNLLPLRASIDGVVVERDVTRGAIVDTDKMLFRVADISHMWLVLDVRQDDIQYISIGQKVLFRPNDTSGAEEIEGSVAWISTEADDETRTVKVRVNLPNRDGGLRANTFGSGRIVLRQEEEATMVPSESVHWDGCCHVVFVRDKHFFEKDSPKFFHVRKVRLGVQDGEATEIIAGLMPGEVIASKGSDVLRSQLLKNNLGEGCTCGQ